MRVTRNKDRSPSPEIIGPSKKRKTTVAPPAPKTAGRAKKQTVSGPPKHSLMAATVQDKKKVAAAAMAAQRAESSQQGSKSTRRVGHRARTANGQPTLPISEVQLHGCLTFTGEQEERYNLLKLLSITPCKFFDTQVLKDVGVYDTIAAYFDTVGWLDLVDFRYPAYTELCQEFYATLEYKPPKVFTPDDALITFRLMNRPFRLSLNNCTTALGLFDSGIAAGPQVSNTIGDFPKQFTKEKHIFWGELTNDHNAKFHPHESKAALIVEPAMRLIHKWLAHCLSARPSTDNVVTKTELCILWCMKRGIRADFSRWMLEQFNSVLGRLTAKNKPALILGAYITRIAVKYELIDITDTDLHVACPIELLDKDCLIRCNILREIGGKLEFKPPKAAAMPQQLDTGAIISWMQSIQGKVDTILANQEMLLDILAPFKSPSPQASPAAST